MYASSAVAFNMQDPNEDTEWNDILRAKGIIPEKPKEKKDITEDDIVQMLEDAVQKKSNGKTPNLIIVLSVIVNRTWYIFQGKTMDEMNLDELDELEDEEEERVLEQYRRQRMAEIQALQAKSRFGDVREISAQDYVQEVNKAGEGIMVVLHLYKQGIPLCALLNQYMSALAAKFPTVKFLKSISTTCIPNYPDKNLPTIFVYYNGEMKTQLAGPMQFRGMNITQDEFEYLLGKTGAVNTTIKDDPKPAVKDVMFSKLGTGQRGDDDDSDGNDW